jgi:hypothetical protein
VLDLVNNAKYAPCGPGYLSVIRSLSLFSSLFLPRSEKPIESERTTQSIMQVSEQKWHWQWQSWLYSTPSGKRRRPALRHWFPHRAALRRTLRSTEYTAAQPWEIRPSVFLVRRTEPMECVAGRSVTEIVHEQIKISLKTHHFKLAFNVYSS